jgi:hypothetical protein
MKKDKSLLLQFNKCQTVRLLCGTNLQSDQLTFAERRDTKSPIIVFCLNLTFLLDFSIFNECIKSLP